MDSDEVKEDQDDDKEGAVVEGSAVDEERPRQRRRLMQQNHDEEYRALCSQNASLQRELQILRAQIERNYQQQERKLNMINQNINRLLAQREQGVVHPNQPAATILPQVAAIPTQQTAAGSAVNVRKSGASTLAATLSPMPKTIHDLWNEYEFGIGGRKAARDFTPTERGGKNKHSYYRRKVVWDCVSTLVLAGWTANAACDRIYETYGRNQSVTNIIRKMLQDRKTGGHPNLKVNKK